jgi:hypothetical protein
MPPNAGGMEGHGGYTNFWLMKLEDEWVVVMHLTAAS